MMILKLNTFSRMQLMYKILVKGLPSGVRLIVRFFLRLCLRACLTLGQGCDGHLSCKFYAWWASWFRSYWLVAHFGCSDLPYRYHSRRHRRVRNEDPALKAPNFKRIGMFWLSSNMLGFVDLSTLVTHITKGHFLPKALRGTTSSSLLSFRYSLPSKSSTSLGASTSVSAAREQARNPRRASITQKAADREAAIDPGSLLRKFKARTEDHPQDTARLNLVS